MSELVAKCSGLIGRICLFTCGKLEITMACFYEVLSFNYHSSSSHLPVQYSSEMYKLYFIIFFYFLYFHHYPLQSPEELRISGLVSVFKNKDSVQRDKVYELYHESMVKICS